MLFYVFSPEFRRKQHQQRRGIKLLPWLCFAYLLLSLPFLFAAMEAHTLSIVHFALTFLVWILLLGLITYLSTDEKYTYTFSILPEKQKIVMQDASGMLHRELHFSDIAAIKVFDSKVTYGSMRHRPARMDGKFILLERRQTEVPDRSLDFDYLWQSGEFVVSYSDEIITALTAATNHFPQHK